MSELFVYALQSALCLTILYIPYRLLLQGETFFSLNRYLLLAIVTLSLGMPMTNITLPERYVLLRSDRGLAAQVALSMEADREETLLNSYSLTAIAESSYTEPVTEPSGIYSKIQPSPVVTGGQSQRLALTFLEAFSLLYIIGVLVMVAICLVSFVRMLRYMYCGNLWSVRGPDGVSIHCHSGNATPFSWMRSIVISERDYRFFADEVLEHERAHVRHLHSLDNLLVAFCQCVQWFNPLVWLLAKSLSDVHEYEADADVVSSGVNAVGYQQLLVLRAAGANCRVNLSMENRFSRHNLKHRIGMMSRNRSNRWKLLKVVLLIPALGLTVISLARPAVVAPVMEKATEALREVVKELPIVMEKPQTELAASIEEQVKKEEALKTEEVTELMVEPTDMEPTDSLQTYESMYFSPEVPASYPGGQAALNAYLAETIGSPDSSDGESQRVLVRMRVYSDGHVDNAEVLTEVSDEAQQRIVDAVTAMPHWLPAYSNGKKGSSMVTLGIDMPIKAD